MDQDQDFSSLRNLLALKKLDVPQDTRVEAFLIEFHRRQRAQLLVPQSWWARSIEWMKERMAALGLVPTLSYGAAFAAVAITAFVGLSQQVQVVQSGGQNWLSFQMPAHESSFAMIPASFGGIALAAPKPSADTMNFNPSRSDSATTRFVLANNSHGAYDATVAF